jgi:hypothetical protein
MPEVRCVVVIVSNMVVGHLPAVRNDLQVNSAFSCAEPASPLGKLGFCIIPDAVSSEMPDELTESVEKADRLQLFHGEPQRDTTSECRK